MLPIALTCPVWWVARWAARMLASLAVVVAFSLGTATLPAGVAAPASGGPAAGLTVRAAVGTPTVPRPERDDSPAARQRDLTRQSDPAGVAEPPLAGAAVAPTGPFPIPAGQSAAPAGPRAPPAR
ncbi:hypothetical protein AB0H28_29625 [Micromonospora sp. NPDC050980]|uniref:hypothetical protein n=1 Tax=Micromonospora sp. NPDC050980 TaxID=3155161 RepID=UPI0033C46ED0